MSLQFVNSTKRLPVAKHLTEEENAILLNTYARHNSSLGLTMRDKYSIANIVKVKRSKRPGVLEVHYADGEWWHYTKDGRWY